MFPINSSKLKLIAAAIISPCVAIFQLMNSACIIHNLKPSVTPRHGYYTYYLEMPNGTRTRQMTNVVYDDYQLQLYFFHGFLAAIVLPGFLMPYLLYLAEKRKQDLFIWWICWITLHNVHAFMQIFTYSMNLVVVIYLDGFDKLVHIDYWNFFSLCNIGSTLNSLGTPLTIYLSIFMIKHYQNLKDISPNGSRNNSNSSTRFQPLLPSALESTQLLIHRAAPSPSNLMAPKENGQKCVI